ncbi:hypothetical protein L210DRAFT_3639323 [Boletus edulis BED1]|uniref:DUF6533 domain-containing protein n=1 Tax=Boletus edulis BED1 TaxID=1328754 RepID=A0AAD4C9E4_BOLED|nr:hypothetical protein L210DRAFT_3639323 [Boletus edulis BED1]
MYSEAQFALARELDNYTSIVIVIALSYDYCLTFSKEVTYIWQRPWTRVSTLFLLVSFLAFNFFAEQTQMSGITRFVTWAGFMPSRFLWAAALLFRARSVCRYDIQQPVSRELLKRTPYMHRMISDVIVSVFRTATFGAWAESRYIKGNILYALGELSYAIFWTGADMVMILRVYALYNRSRIILGGLLVLYVVEVVILVVSASIYSDPKYVKVTIIQLLGITVCNPVLNTNTWNTATAVVQFVHGTVLSFLVVAKFVGDSLRTYQATRKWQFNRYISLLVRDGFFYFLVYVPPSPSFFSRHSELMRQHNDISTLLNSLINLLGVLGTLPGGWGGPALVVVATVPLFTLTPRFVMNIRELYVRDAQGRWDRDIDTGFGLSNGAGGGVGVSTTIGTIAFAEGIATGESEDGQETATVEESGEGSGRLVNQNGGLEWGVAPIGG